MPTGVAAAIVFALSLGLLLIRPRRVPLAPAGAEWIALHVIDARPRVDLAVLRSGLPGGGQLPAAQRDAIEAAGRQHAEATTAAATSAMAARGLTTGPAEIRVGEPGRAICAVASDLGADLVVLSSDRRANRPSSGPASVGHTARFVLDHAPCPVLLLRAARMPYTPS